MNDYLLIFTLGPVQSFIAQARKTQDLHAGSGMLSALTRQTFERVQEEMGEKNVSCIFPKFTDQNGQAVASNPNRFAAIVSNIPPRELKEKCQQVKKDILSRFVRDGWAMLQNAYQSKGQVEVLAKAQLTAHPEVFWVAVPLDDNYPEQYQKIEGYLGGIKNIRDFTQLEEAGRKCNVDGIRNALFVKHQVSDRGKVHDKPPSFVKAGEYCPVYPTDTRLEAGEGLSAVSMYKRLCGDARPAPFPSTAAVALMERLKQIQAKPALKILLDDYKSHFDPKLWDEQLLFEENLTAKYFKKKGLSVNLVNGKLQMREDILEAYQTLTDAAGHFAPSYYAILAFDGDHMGQWMSGKFLTNETKHHVKAFQEKMRDLLRDYASWAETYLTDPKGAVVYAGGDDFLGLVNLHHLLPVLKRMRLKFDEMINRPLLNEASQFKIKAGENFTFSAGIAIAHYKEPLNLVVQEARATEEKAKEAGRNAFAISVIRHSGGTTRCIMPFCREMTLATNAMKCITQQLTEKTFSNQFIHNLIHETRSWAAADPRELFDLEAKRLIRRANNLKAPEAKKEANKAMYEKVKLLTNLQTNEDKLDRQALDNIVNTLRICDFLYRTTKPTES